MAGKSKKAANYETELVWVINNLSKKEVAAYDKLAAETPEFFDGVMAQMTELCEAGWKMGVKWDTYSNSLQCTLIQLDKEKPNHGFALSARGEDILDCIGLVWYKFFHVAKQDLTSVETSELNIRG